MKKQLVFLLAIMFILSLTLPICVASSTVNLDCITDDTGILTEDEWLELENTAQVSVDKYSCSLYVMILDDYSSYGYSVNEACNNIYSYYTLGNKTNGNAIVMLLSISDRDYCIMDYGDYGEYALTDIGRQSLEEVMLDDFANDNWYAGISDYLEQADEILSEAYADYYDTDTAPASFGQRAVKAYGIALVVGLIVAAITCSSYKAQMKTAVKATNAKEYVSPENVIMQIRDDRYVNTTQSKRKIENTANNGDGKSGGSGKF